MQSAFAASNQQFGLDLFRLAYQASLGLTDPAARKVVQLSPFSIRRALTMANIGARGLTRKAILDAMRYPAGTDLLDVNRDNQAIAKWLKTVEANAGQGKSPTTMHLANALWLRQSDAPDAPTFHQQFIDDNQTYFDAECVRLAFDTAALDRINGWADTNTNHKINKIISELPADAWAVLTDALYMKTPAKNRFYRVNDRLGKFFGLDANAEGLAAEGVDATYMRQRGAFDYLQSDGVQLLRFPFGVNGNFNFYLVLPDLDSDLTSAVNGLCSNWTGWLENLADGYGVLRIAQNEQEWGKDVVPELALQGMGLAFSDDADFLGMCTRACKIGAVMHKTKTALTHKGFEGAAVTAVTMVECTSVMPKIPPRQFDITANRPYAWLVTGGDEILFAGTTVKPETPAVQDADDPNDLGWDIQDEADLNTLN